MKVREGPDLSLCCLSVSPTDFRTRSVPVLLSLQEGPELIGPSCRLSKGMLAVQPHVNRYMIGNCSIVLREGLDEGRDVAVVQG